MDCIKIDISGSVNVGKSTIAAILTKALKEAGIEYDLRNEDDEKSLILRELELPNRLKVLADKNLKIIINQTQLHRNWQDM